jgi:heat shock protein HtpX
MAFDFWAAQRAARSRTWWYVTLFLIFTLISAVLAELTMRAWMGEDYSPYPVVGGILLVVTFVVTLFEYTMYANFGGKYVAESVGARRVNPNTSDPKEVQLLNVVREMSVASGTPMPPVYILDNAKEINAFAAGLTKDNAAVCVTRGTLALLTREELQGVIGHEFGHIFNGDMKISMRIAAMVMGFFFLLYIALRILQFTPSRRDREEGKGNPIVIAALILAVASALNYFLGSILKAAVSRQREYLADACAVQFTRNPNGISGALKKIMREQYMDMPRSGMAYSHLYFNNRINFTSLFATHPPLEKRIEAIDNRTYMPEEWKTIIGDNGQGSQRQSSQRV